MYALLLLFCIRFHELLLWEYDIPFYVYLPASLLMLLMLLLFHFLIYRSRFFTWLFLTAALVSIIFSVFMIFGVPHRSDSDALGLFFLFVVLFLLIILPVIMVCTWRLLLSEQYMENMGFVLFCPVGMLIFLAPYALIASGIISVIISGVRS